MSAKSWGWVLLFAAMVVCSAASVAQEPANQDANGNPPQRQGQGRGWSEGQNGPRPLFGRITSMSAGTIVLTRQDGQTVTVKLTDQTEFRKEREKATAADFKVGDMVMVRGDENADHTVTAKLIGTRGGGPGGGPGAVSLGTLGKDYVAGEVKSVEAPKLTVLRPDNVTQTMELNEETTIRKNRESITMADIQVLPHNQEALPVELRGARASMACQHPTTPRGSAAVLSRNRAKSPERAFCPAGHFLHAYRANRRSAIEEVVDADEVAARIRDTWPSGAVWKGNATELSARRGRAGTRIIRMGKTRSEAAATETVPTARTSLKKLLSEGFERTSRNPTGLALSRVRH